MQDDLAQGGDGARDGMSIDGTIFRVLVNDTGQHSLWPADQSVPEGWRSVGPVAGKAACLAWIEAAWTDMRPRPVQ